MPSHLHICVTFLQPTCHARFGKEVAAPNEWPPSPLRLFQAMIAGAAARWAGDDGATIGALSAAAPVAALKWIESLCVNSPPTILAPRAVTGQAVPRYVPNNSADLVTAKWSRGDALATFEDRTKKVFRPTHLLDGTTVHYLWPLTEDQLRDARGHEQTIATAARCIVALGWGIDAAVGDACILDDEQAATLGGGAIERWKPARIGSPGLRLPVRGTLDAVSTRYAAFLNRLKDGVLQPLPPLREFTTACYCRDLDIPLRSFAAFKLLPLDGIDDRLAAFPQYRAVHLAAMLRHAVCEAAKKDPKVHFPGGAEQFVAGHGPRKSNGKFVDESWPRLSYLPLPSFEGRSHNVVGAIRRVIVAELSGRDCTDSISWVRQRLNGELLIDEHTGNPMAILMPLADSDYVLQQYIGQTRESPVWASVTPVILPGYDDAKAAKRERLLHACLRHAGLLEAVEDIESRPPSWFPGVVSNAHFNDKNDKGSFKRRPEHLRHLPAVHVRVRFRQPVRGPISLGAGRHCGLGVLAATKE